MTDGRLARALKLSRKLILTLIQYSYWGNRGVTETASYADVLHRMAMGEEVLGEEILALPGSESLGPGVVGPLRSMLCDVPDLVEQVVTADEDPYVVGAMARIVDELRTKSVTYPLPELIRLTLWSAGSMADFNHSMRKLTHA